MLYLETCISFFPSTADCGMTSCLCSSQPHEWAQWAPAVVLHNSTYVIFIFTRLQFHFFPFAFPQNKKSHHSGWECLQDTFV